MTSARERLDRVRESLVRLRDETDADVSALASSLEDVRSARADGTADDEHDPEGSTLTSDWSHLYGLSATVAARVGEIHGAIERLDAGLYGSCTACGSAISAARLAARPAAQHCIDCAQRLEKSRRG